MAVKHNKGNNIPPDKSITDWVNFNPKLFNKFKKIQFSPGYKKRKSHFIIKNNFTKKSVNIAIKNIINEVL